jgi:hypothetical protein
MTRVIRTLIVWLAAGAAGLAMQAPSPAEIAGAVDRLGSLDAYDTRMEAARTIRRWPADRVVPVLAEAARGHRDEYVRFRALVLLSGFSHATTGALMRQLMADRNDRIRTVVCAWYEHHPDAAALPALLDALAAERSEFVRPALTRAVAAHGRDERARAALLPLVARGEDFFRGAVIEALGDVRAGWALAEIEAVARLDGPLQDDAITAIGKIGDAGRLPLLLELQRSAPEALQPTLSAAICLLGFDCAGHKTFIRETLAFAAGEERQPLLRGAVHALGVLAVAGHADAMAALVDAGVRARAPAQAPIALGVGTVALRRPAMLLGAVAASPARDEAVLLARDAFDMLNEDFEEERFFVAVREAFWSAPEGSSERRAAEALIRLLEF